MRDDVHGTLESQVLPKSFGKSASPPITAENALTALCASSCAVPTTDESNHSAVGALHLHCAVPRKIEIGHPSRT